MLFNSAKSTVKYFLLIDLFLAIVSVSSYAQTVENSKERSFLEINKTDNSITIDGSIEEKAWQNGASIPLNYAHFPEANAEPPVKTICFITYDSDNLYVSFKAIDPRPNEIRAHLMDRDDQEKLMRDDHIGFTIDPFNNGQWGIQFRVNPFGVQADAIYSNQRNSTDYSWDGIWESGGTVTKNGYEVEIRIPISSINVPSESIQNWQFSAFRNYPRSVQHRIRSHRIDLNNQSSMAQFNQIKGFQNLSSGLNLKLNPVLTVKRSDNSTANAEGLNQGSAKLSPGGNIQWGIQPNLNLSATVNPDFSQIEADALQFRENRRFALSFPEKRPFFLEGSEIFETPLNAVFTRSVIQPNAGLKMTGKLDSQSFGTFITQDQSSRILFPANQSSQSEILDERSYSEILRYRNQLTDNAAIGVLGEARQSGTNNYQNYAGGIDGYLRFLKSNSLRLQYMQSTTNYPQDIVEDYNQPTDNFGGNALRINYNHNSQHWVNQAEYTSISSGFRNDNGFFPRVDFQTFRAVSQRVFRGNPTNWFSSIQFGPAFEITTDQSGTLTDRAASFSASYTGPLQSQVSATYTLAKQRFGNRIFSGLDTGVLFFRIQPSSFLSKFRLYTAYGGAIDFTNVRRANQLIIHPGLTLNISRSLNLEIDPNFQRLSHNGETTFSTYLLGTRLMYHFNKKTYIRSIFQYRYVNRNLSEFNNPDAFNSTTESFFYQMLFSYRVNPQSKLFLGYSSGYGEINNNPVRIQSRTGYLKIGYAWVF